jgi:hypothetical protein
MSLIRHLTNDEHTHRFNVTMDVEGWDVREEEDSAVLRRGHHEDWHHAERDIQLFEIRARALKREGWIEICRISKRDRPHTVLRRSTRRPCQISVIQFVGDRKRRRLGS